jgi:predicted TIM-barrel fold metal-dependent hydrolase
LIDCHTHIIAPWNTEPLTEDKLLDAVDALGIERYVILPIGVSPETPYAYTGTEEVLKAYHRHPDRIIPFCSLDPRNGSNSPQTDFSWILGKYKEEGCKGLGELTANLYIDDPKCKNLFNHCGRAGLPVLFHLAERFSGTYGVVDDAGLPRLEGCLQECASTAFIGHGPAFWSEISLNVDESTRGGYPKGEVVPGRLTQLLKEHPNLYGDLSADSGFNAITRDPDYGYDFLEEFKDKLLFGTDLCDVGQSVPIVGYFRQGLKEGTISQTTYDKITERNAQRVINLG